MHAAEVAAYGQAQGAFATNQGLRAAVAASPFPNGGVVLPLVFHVIHWRGFNSLSDSRAVAVVDGQLQSQWAALQEVSERPTRCYLARPRARPRPAHPD